jgi:hypothetical protein
VEAVGKPFAVHADRLWDANGYLDLFVARTN